MIERDDEARGDAIDVALPPSAPAPVDGSPFQMRCRCARK
jgi:hypothetical protein